MKCSRCYANVAWDCYTITRTTHDCTETINLCLACMMWLLSPPRMRSLKGILFHAGWKQTTLPL